MSLLSIFHRKPDPLERRTGRFILRPHESQANRYRIIKKSNGRCLGIIDELRRAEDLVKRMESHVDEHERKRARIERMIAERKARWKYVGEVKNERAA